MYPFRSGDVALNLKTKAPVKNAVVGRRDTVVSTSSASHTPWVVGVDRERAVLNTLSTQLTSPTNNSTHFSVQLSYISW